MYLIISEVSGHRTGRKLPRKHNPLLHKMDSSPALVGPLAMPTWYHGHNTQSSLQLMPPVQPPQLLLQPPAAFLPSQRRLHRAKCLLLSLQLPGFLWSRPRLLSIVSEVFCYWEASSHSTERHK